MSKRPTETRRDVRSVLDPLYQDLEDITKRLDNLENGGGGVRYMLVEEQQTAGTAGGTFTLGAWRTRVLNTVVSDVRGIIVALGSNQITLPKGIYRFQASAPAYKVGSHQARLFNITAAAVLGLGSSEYTDPASGVNDATRSFVSGRFVLAVESDIELQHQCGSTQLADGFGRAVGWGVEVYSRVELWRE